MGYAIRIPKKYFYKLRNMCENYSSYRECVLKEIEKKYNYQIYNSKKPHDMRIYSDNIPKPVFVIFFREESNKLEELARKLGKTKYEIIMSIFE
jgi:predicted DNA-binding protein